MTSRMHTSPVGKTTALALLSLTVFMGLARVPGAAATSCPSGQYCGTVYYTLFSPGTVGVFTFTYDPGTSFSFSSGPTVIASSLPHGADGIIVNPQNAADLLVGTNDNTNNFNDVTTGGVVTSHSLLSSGVFPYNMMSNTAGTLLYADADGGQNVLTSVPLTPSIGIGTTIFFTAASTDTVLNTIAFVAGTAYYVAETSARFGGQTGHVGVITFSGTTATTTCFKDVSGACITYNGAHGLSFDPHSGDLIVFGANEINQVSTTGTLVAHEAVAFAAGLVFDQGSADGFGHVLLASNTGFLFFEDFRATSVGAAGNFEFITNSGGAFNNMDDLAPLVGPGAPPTSVPEFPSGLVAVLAVAMPILLLLRTRLAGKPR